MARVEPTGQAVLVDVGAVRPGTRVEVRSSFNGSWVGGFAVVEHDETGYRLRRLSEARRLIPA